MQEIDSVRLGRWLNVRKLTPALAAEKAGMDVDAMRGLVDSGGTLTAAQLGRLCETLAVGAEQLRPGDGRTPTVMVQRREEMIATRRSIDRDGIHFYDYYSLPAPAGRVAPVILDILCPADHLPPLNNGHLEPALTVNLGPGPINGRWGEELDAETWRVLEAGDGDDAWITGASYVEPSYQPHTYSLASERPARIVSYTAPSGLRDLVDDCDEWSDAAFAELADGLAAGDGTPTRLATGLARRGHDAGSAAAAAGIAEDALAAALAGRGSLSPEDAMALGAALGLDYRLLLPRDAREDSLGRAFATVARSRASARRFRGHEVASMACAPHLPDLVGLFVRVDGAAPPLDLSEHGETHYLVTAGAVRVHWLDDGEGREAVLGTDDALWVAPYVRHSFDGDGALVKLGHGGVLDAGADLELDTCFRPAATLRRARRDRRGWGFDGEVVG
jgi:hypothetical protein